MLIISEEDFYQKISSIPRLRREEEIKYATLMKNGDYEARQKIIDSYLFMVAGQNKRAPEKIRGMSLILTLIQTLERAVDSFDFLQESETFIHRLSLYFKNDTIKFLASR